MKKLSELYQGYPDIEVKDIKINSKEVEKKDIFVCIKGVTTDRHDFIDEAVANGASFLVVGKGEGYSIPYIKVADPNKELPLLAQKLYNTDTSKIKLIGITGTDGKTTTATIMRDLLGIDECGYIGTNGVLGQNLSGKNNNTTPESHLLYKYLSKFIEEGLTYASIETSSEAFYRNRLDTFKFDIGILTNVTGDHLNIHKTMDNYIESKKKLFLNLKEEGIAILNHDDKYFECFNNIAKNQLTYGKNLNADLVIKDILELPNKTTITYSYKGNTFSIDSPLLGEFNVYNLSCCILVLITLGVSISDIKKRVKFIKSPSGRCEFLDFNTPYKIVLDYAHTEGGLKSILSYLQKIRKNKIITVVGSAGGREKEKRNKMGSVVLEKSDLVIFTMDDPRWEDPSDIINQMLKDNEGTYKIIIDRKEAIKYALDNAKKGDIVLIAGKGRDNYMAIEDKYIPYCDYDVIEQYFLGK